MPPIFAVRLRAHHDSLRFAIHRVDRFRLSRGRRAEEGRAEARIQPRRAAHPGRALLPVPRARQCRAESRICGSISATRRSRPAHLAGQADESELIRRIFAEDETERMPPEKIHKPLKPEQKEMLKRWIASGAEYQPHWSLIAPTRPELPVLTQPGSPDPQSDRCLRHCRTRKSVASRWRRKPIAARWPAG